MELTLSIPCQALLLFDADIPHQALEDLYPVLDWQRTDYALAQWHLCRP